MTGVKITKKSKVKVVLVELKKIQIKMSLDPFIFNKVAL